MCMELYQPEGAQMPHVLPCAHTLCHACTQGIKTTDNKPGTSLWRCPSCQVATAQEPKPNFSLRDLIPTLSKMCVEPAPPAAPCEECEEATATPLFCCHKAVATPATPQF